MKAVLRPASTTDWVSERSREQLREFGIAPPRQLLQLAVACRRCGSPRTRLVPRMLDKARANLTLQVGELLRLVQP